MGACKRSNIVMSNEKKLDYSLNLLVIGDDWSGKTQLLERFVNNRYHDGHKEPQDYLHDLAAKKVLDIDGKTVQAKIAFGGEKQSDGYAHEWSRVFKNAQVIIIACDLTDDKLFSRLKEWEQRIRYRNDSTAVMIIGTKADLASERQVDPEKIRAHAEAQGFLYSETSSKTGQNVNQAFQLVIKQSLMNNGVLYQWTPRDNSNLTEMLKLQSKEDKIKTPFVKAAISSVRSNRNSNALERIKKMEDPKEIQAYYDALKNQLRDIRNKKDPESESQKTAIGGVMSKLRTRESELRSNVVIEQLLSASTQHNRVLVRQLEKAIDEFNPRGVSKGILYDFLQYYNKITTNLNDKKQLSELDKILGKMIKTLSDPRAVATSERLTEVKKSMVEALFVLNKTSEIPHSLHAELKEIIVSKSSEQSKAPVSQSKK
jgi:Ras-related protein Rab-2A